MRTCGRWRGVRLVVATLLLVGYVGWGGFLVRSGWGQPEPAMEPQRPALKPADRVVRVASIQYAPVFGKPQENRTALIELVRKAALGGAKIIVMPETAVPGYLSANHRVNWQVEGRPLDPAYSGRSPAEVAETVPGESSVAFGVVARELKVYVAMTLIEKSGEGDEVRYFNTMCLLSPSGELVGHYRKLHPYPPTEKSWATPGDRGVQVVETEYGKVAMAICYDIHFVLDEYDKHEPWALLFSSSWVSEEFPADWFWQAMPEKAVKHHLNVIGANWSSEKPQSWRGYGFSEIIRSDGEVLACTHRLLGSDIVYADLPCAPEK